MNDTPERSAKNVYMRHGFVVLDSFTLPEGGPEVFTMWRDASPASRSGTTSASG